jgi:hypothetical protein
MIIAKQVIGDDADHAGIKGGQNYTRVVRLDAGRSAAD